MRRVDISHKTVFFIAGFLGLLWLLYLIVDVIVLLFVAVILMSALSPAVDYLMRRRFPKALAVAVVYIAVLVLLIVLLSVIVTPLVSQTSSLITNLPHTLEKLFFSFGIDRSVVQDGLAGLTKNVLSFSLTLFSNVLSLISIAVLTFYLLLDKDRVYGLILQLFPDRRERNVQLIAKIETKLGSWLRGQVVLSLIIGALSYTLLFAFGVPYALPLAILAGFMEVIPVIGPIISALPAVLVAYVISPALALFIALGYFAIQQAENHFIVPQVMRKAVGLNPLIVIIAIAIGAKLLGIMGALLAVPITVVGQILVEELFHVQLDAYASIDPEEKKG